MPRVRRVDLPEAALLARYAGVAGTHVDCHATFVPGAVSLERLAVALFGSPVFLPERLVLAAVLRRRIDIAEAGDMARGRRDHFAVWEVEARAPREILLREMTGRTRSWLAVRATDDGARTGTTLYFGSAMMPSPGRFERAAFRVLRPLHLTYARLLLGAARDRI